MYVGMASGITSRRSISVRPGKRYIVTNHAVAVPTISVNRPTPNVSTSVSRRARGRTFSSRCGQMLSVGMTASRPIVTSGNSIAVTTSAATTVQPDDAVRRAYHAVIVRGTPVIARAMLCSDGGRVEGEAWSRMGHGPSGTFSRGSSVPGVYPDGKCQNSA